ncbi:MAG: S9 family peptidase [Burkholderiaceae bacterium]|nr:MAG: S9 family peptidase [Burkholderiaceae bacterium]
MKNVQPTLVAKAALLCLLPLALSTGLTSVASAADERSDPAVREQIKKYLEPARYANATLSPDGRHLAVLSPVGTRRNLVVINLETREPKVITSLSEFDVMSVRWIGANYLAFSLGDMSAPGGAEYQDGGGLFVVHREGGNVREFQPTVRAAMNRGLGFLPRFSILSSVGGDSDEFIAVANERSREHSDLYRVSASTGRKTLLTFERPGRVVDWVLDHEQNIRGAVVLRELSGADAAAEPDEQAGAEAPKGGKVFQRVLMWRDVVGGAWRDVTDLGRGAKAIHPVAPAGEGELWVSTARGRDTTALFKMSLRTGKLEDAPFVDNPRFDIENDATGESVPGLMFHPVTRKPYAVAIEGDIPELYYLDDDLDSLHRSLQASFPGQQVSLQPSSGSKVLVNVSSDVKPQQIYLFDTQTRKLSHELDTRPQLKDGDLQPMHPFLLKTRDGLEIPGYYVLPKGYKEGQRLPTLVHIHGGPHARADLFGPGRGTGVREAQVLASQGFAVVIPNFRITPGMGRKIYMSGFGTVGTKMSEDHEDAMQWAVKAGFADPQRVCIGGSSYGGYATLRALTKTPDLFACGVAGLVVSDLELQLTSQSTDFGGSAEAIRHWRRMIGEKGTGWEQSRAVSPARQLGQITSPLMIWAGRDDFRTPLEQYERVVSGMKALGKTPDVMMVKDGEAHGYRKPENVLDLYEQMVLFLKRHIGTSRTRVTSGELTGQSAP